MRTPAAKRKALVLLAGAVWTLVGVGLTLAAIGWMPHRSGAVLIILLAGILGGVMIYYLGFRKLARRNLNRIYEQAPGKEKVCLFAFQNRRSYLLVIVMIIMGYSLRHSSLPKPYLSPLYLAIGVGLILASMVYYWDLIKGIKPGQ